MEGVGGIYRRQGAISMSSPKSNRGRGSKRPGGGARRKELLTAENTRFKEGRPFYVPMRMWALYPENFGGFHSMPYFVAADQSNVPRLSR
jgi:hypothetical protein